jgi:hypothetical protein
MRVIDAVVDFMRSAWQWVRSQFRGKRDKTPNPITNFELRYDEMSNARLSWVWPTTRVEGEALPESQIQHNEISVSADGGSNFSGLAQVAPPTTEHVVADLAPGTYIFRGVVVDKDDRRSDAVDATGSVLSAPSALGDFTVTIE